MINEVNAEMLLELMYPELEQKWIVRNKGTFYRNYSSDVLNVYPDEPTVELSRDGFLSLLPSALLSKENELAERDINGRKKRVDMDTRKEQMKRRMHLLTEAFVPFDTFAFRRRLTLERHISELLDKKLSFVLKEYYDVNIDTIKNDYVRQIAVLLPYVPKLRGDMKFIAKLLKDVTGFPVRMRKSSFSSTDNTRVWMPKIHYDIIIEGLSHDEYLAKTEELAPLADFITEYLIPFDCFSEISIKGSRIDGSPLLNYNAYV